MLVLETEVGASEEQQGLLTTELALCFGFWFGLFNVQGRTHNLPCLLLPGCCITGMYLHTQGSGCAFEFQQVSCCVVKSDF